MATAALTMWTGPGIAQRAAAPVFRPIRIRHPTPGLQLAADPRIPDEHERFRFALTDDRAYRRVEWFVNHELVAVGADSTYLWPVRRGRHVVQARAALEDDPQVVETAPVTFLVK